jgi:large subunit ribosomal protein L32e
MKQIIIKKKKPVFLKTDANRVKKLVKNWRRPKGMHNKIRLCKASHRWHPSIGYGNPKEIRTLTKEGLKPITIISLTELKALKEGEVAVLSSLMGNKTKLELAKYAKEKNIRLLNLKNPDQFIAELENKLKSKKQEKETKEKKKEEFKKKAEERVKEKEKKEAELTPEEKEKNEKEEKRRVLENKSAPNKQATKESQEKIEVE